MMTNFKFSSKMHLFIIISCALIVIGLAVGLGCRYGANGYFNYGGEWANYKSVTVTYEAVDATESEIREICDDAFSKAGIKSYTSAYGKRGTGGAITYKFRLSTDNVKLENAVILINAAIDGQSEGDITLSVASAVYNGETRPAADKVLRLGAIALAVIIVFHFAYFAVRFKLTMAFAALLADVHNFVLFLALLAIMRIPVGSSVVAFAVLTVLITVIGTCFLFDRMRKYLKDEAVQKLNAFERADKCAGESFKVNTLIPASLAVVAALLFVLLSISALSAFAIISPVLCALICFITCAYGTAMFTPSVYSRFAQIGEAYKKNHTRTPKDKSVKNKTFNRA